MGKIHAMGKIHRAHHLLLKLNPRTLIPSSFTTAHPHRLTSALSLCTSINPAHPETRPITPEKLQDFIKASQWHFIKHLTPDSVRQALLNLRSSPETVLDFINNVDPHCLDLDCYCLAISILSENSPPKHAIQLTGRALSCDGASVIEVFDGLLRAREALKVSSSTMMHLLIRALCDIKDERASECFEKMKEKGIVPKVTTYNALIKGYCDTRELKKAFQYKDDMIKNGIIPTVFTYNPLIYALFRKGHTKEADGLVEEMRGKGILPDAATYDMLIYRHCVEDNAREAFSLYDEMLTTGVEPSRFTYMLLILVFGKQKRMKEADNLFAIAQKRGVLPDLGMFNVLIFGYCTNGNVERGLSLLEEMNKMKIHPDGFTYSSIMLSYCLQGKVEDARKLLVKMEESGTQPNCNSYNIIISGYSWRGDNEDALKMRDEMRSRGFNPTWAYNIFGRGPCKNFPELLREMVSQGITPDNKTFAPLTEVIGKSLIEDEASSS